MRWLIIVKVVGGNPPFMDHVLGTSTEHFTGVISFNLPNGPMTSSLLLSQNHREGKYSSERLNN